MKLRITLFFRFIWLCIKSPLTIKENYYDIKQSYRLYHDEELYNYTIDVDPVHDDDKGNY